MTTQLVCKVKGCGKPITSNLLEQMTEKCSECLLKSALAKPVVWYFCPKCNHRIDELVQGELGTCEICNLVLHEWIDGKLTRTVELVQRTPTEDELQKEKERIDSFWKQFEGL